MRYSCSVSLTTELLVAIMRSVARDYRSDKMETLEGRGVARRRWRDFRQDVPDDVWEDIYEAQVEAGIIQRSSGFDPDDEPFEENDVPDEVLEEMAKRVREDSELLGFYIAWHRAGGFANLQSAGWHRATIHRKIRRFRSRFGSHPDEFRLPWLTLDLEKAWKQELVDAMNPPQVLDEPY
jgi:hypothetical protein